MVPVPHPTWRLVPTGNDPRARETTYLFELENGGLSTVHLKTLTPITNEHLRVHEESKLVVVEAQRRVEEVCDDFRRMLVEYVAEALGDPPKRFMLSEYPRLLGRFYDNVTSNLALSLLLPLFFLAWLYRHSRAVLRLAAFPPHPRQERAEQLVPPMRTRDEAIQVGAHWLDSWRDGEGGREPLNSTAQALRQACLVRLETLRGLPADDGEGRYIASVPPDQAYRRPFVVEGRRRFLRWREFVISVEARYDETYDDVPYCAWQPTGLLAKATIAMASAAPQVAAVTHPTGAADQAGSAEPDADRPNGQDPPGSPTEGSAGSRSAGTSGAARVETVHAVLRVSPHPMIVTFVAVLGAFAGMLLVPPAGLPVPTSIGAQLAWPFTPAVVAQWLPIAVLAAVFFNIADFTVLGPQLSRHLDWRGALVIGLICGLGSVPITDVLQKLVPDTTQAESGAGDAASGGAATVSAPPASPASAQTAGAAAPAASTVVTVPTVGTAPPASPFP